MCVLCVSVDGSVCLHISVCLCVRCVVCGHGGGCGGGGGGCVCVCVCVRAHVCVHMCMYITAVSMLVTHSKCLTEHPDPHNKQQ